MIGYFQKHIFAKIGFLFFSATVVLIVSAYYFFDWSVEPSDNILDAHDAYYHYKLVSSWGSPPDTTKILKELKNLHFNASVFIADNDTICENDTTVYWSNFKHYINLCDYESFSDSRFLGKEHNISFPAYVSFGDIYINNSFKQATLVEFDQYKYLLVVDFLFPNRGFNVFPLLVLSVVFMFFLYLLVRRFLLPLNLIKKRIIKLEGGDFESEIKISGKDELAALSKNINRMVLDMKLLLNQKERLLSDVSHELRSPLAKIRLSLAMIPPHKKISAVEKQIKTLDSLITNILLSDQMSTPYSNLDKTEIFVKELVDNSLELTFVKGVFVEIDKDFKIRCDVVKLSVAIKNLIENAHKYAGEGVDIKVFAINEGDCALISVEDGGVGVSKESAKKITKAFVRGKNQQKEGFGLGLSICKKVMEAHGGSLLIKKSSLGGASFVLELPVDSE